LGAKTSVNNTKHKAIEVELLSLALCCQSISITVVVLFYICEELISEAQLLCIYVFWYNVKVWQCCHASSLQKSCVYIVWMCTFIFSLHTRLHTTSSDGLLVTTNRSKAKEHFWTASIAL